jgi:hypothetical protein
MFTVQPLARILLAPEILQCGKIGGAKMNGAFHSIGAKKGSKKASSYKPLAR